ncbi:baseplate J/gp47 family protein [Otariodibacter oris]|uniref:Putative phage protein gp47/JayE n=1 Tax=Otariodibacter oris TaxID=1032623 RepID=A0A420XIW6_9PAST|nr:baseplate J/gp47 family protein [Otariodibacter oris]QGM80654.1 baseplate J protein [Otariodibacter oris]RKR77186.1 putative phage protein gp47/JayE [Otariodibacter oris]
MAFITPTLEEIRDSILRDISSLEPRADISSDSDYYVRASALASCLSGIYAHQNWIARQAFPDTADSDYLEMHAGLRKIYRKNATYATGIVEVSGVVGSFVSENLIIKTEDDRYYITSSSGVIPEEGVIQISVIASSSGVVGNLKNSTPATFMSAPVGVSSECLLLSVNGGTDQESDAELLVRLLERIRRPPSGGNKNDYKNWALSVDGVSSAYVYPLRRGEGTVDIAITSGDGLPSDEIVLACQNFIDSVRPVTAKSSLVIKPVLKPVNFEIEVKLDEEMELEVITKDIEQALSEYFLGLKPADPLVVSQIEAVVSDLIGVVDRKIVKPNANQQIDAYSEMGWFKLGSLVVREMS